MDIRKITDDYTVSSQITVEDVARIRDMGYAAIMCNRPDGETPGQPPVASIRAEAEAQGLPFAFIPFTSGQIDAPLVERFRAAIDELPRPVFAYCRSGARCHNIWMQALLGPQG